MPRVVRLDLAPSLSTAERLDAAFARAKQLDDGTSPKVVAIVEFSMRPDESVLMRLDRADLFLRDGTAGDVSTDEQAALRQWMRTNHSEVVRWRGDVRAKPFNPGETRWSESTSSRGVSEHPRTVVVDGKEVVLPAGTPVSRRSVRWGRTQGTLPPSEPDAPAG